MLISFCAALPTRAYALQVPKSLWSATFRRVKTFNFPDIVMVSARTLASAPAREVVLSLLFADAVFEASALNDDDGGWVTSTAVAATLRASKIDAAFAARASYLIRCAAA